MKRCLLVLGLLILISCKKVENEPFGFNFYFENLQPINDSELLQIPNKFQGLFMNSDSVYVNIQENMILKEFYNKFRFHKRDFDSVKVDFDKVGSKYVSKFNKYIYEVKYIKDSVEFSNKQIDTFLILSNTQKAKRFNGQLILNYRDSVFWTIKSIRLEKNILKIKYIYSKEDLKRMDSLTKLKSIMIDSFSFIVKPSRNELKRILNLKRLGEELVYKKVRNN